MTIPSKEDYGFIDNSEDRFIDKNYIDLIKSIKTYWFIFQIENSIITIQGWENNTGSGSHVLTKYGKILNDTTFVLNQEIVDDKSKKINEKYEFREFSPKPDSTNVYIK